jgi:hypothetical protein
MKSAMIAIASAALVATADAHAHLSRVNTSAGESASNRAGIRDGIVRDAGSGIPGSESGYACDWCVLEGSNRDETRYPAQWWSQNPGSYTESPNMWPAVPCMSRDTYGATGVLDIRAGENITTTTFVNADHGGFYRFEVGYNNEPSNIDFHSNPVSDYYALSDNEGLNSQYPGRRVGPADADLQQYIQQMNCVGAGCGGNIRNRDYSETWTFPANAPSGPAVMRWLWSSLETPEIYAHCVDINIVGGGAPNPPGSPTSAPPSPTAAPPAPTPAPGGQCAPHYGQCGGIGWTGETVCCDGRNCQFGNDYYSQCL